MLTYKKILHHPKFSVHALAFIPEKSSTAFAIGTHGYTAHKGTILPWATRLCDMGIPTVIFDQPGHYLGSFFEVEHFSDFTEHATELYEIAFDWLKELAESSPSHLILMGHSLGALTSLKASNLSWTQNFKTATIAVGYGQPPADKTHLFDTDFYRKTLETRKQLVSPAMCPENVFPWIKEQKIQLKIEAKRLFLLAGKDDVVIEGGLYPLAEKLKAMNNHVTVEEPSKLPHHMPEMAAPFIASMVKSFLKENS